MYQKVLCFAVLIAAVSASGHSQAYSSVHVSKVDGHEEVIPVISHGHGEGHGHGHHSIDYYTVPQYEFEYKVVDPHTGDIKAQQERRLGDHVKGYYALNQPDGSERHVQYESDKHSGFRANVKYGTHHLAKYYHH